MSPFRAGSAIVATVCLALALVAPPASAERYRRHFSWSGYTWQVRLARGENPGHNTWWDSTGNVRVKRDGTLRLAITRAGAVRRSVELATVRRLGYGRYRWVVGTPLEAIGAYTVLALFTNDTVHRAPYAEQDFEFARWGVEGGPPGWAVSWANRVKSYDSFGLTPAAPYTVDIVWRRGEVRHRITDATGAVLYDRARQVASNGRFMVARMSYWLYPGYPSDLQPAPITIRDFAFTPLSRLR